MPASAGASSSSNGAMMSTLIMAANIGDQPAAAVGVHLRRERTAHRREPRRAGHHAAGKRVRIDADPPYAGQVRRVQRPDAGRLDKNSATIASALIELLAHGAPAD